MGYELETVKALFESSPSNETAADFLDVLMTDSVDGTIDNEALFQGLASIQEYLKFHQ